MRKAVKKAKGCFGQVLRDLERQARVQGKDLTDKQQALLTQAWRLLDSAVTRNIVCNAVPFQQ